MRSLSNLWFKKNCILLVSIAYYPNELNWTDYRYNVITSCKITIKIVIYSLQDFGVISRKIWINHITEQSFTFLKIKQPIVDMIPLSKAIDTNKVETTSGSIKGKNFLKTLVHILSFDLLGHLAVSRVYRCKTLEI